MALKDEIRKDYLLRGRLGCYANHAPDYGREGESESVIIHADHPDAIDRTEVIAHYFKASKQYWIHEKGRGGLSMDDYWTGPYHLMRPEFLKAVRVTSKDVIITVENRGNTGKIDFCAKVEETRKGHKVTFYRHTPDLGEGDQEPVHLSFTLGELGLVTAKGVAVGNRIAGG